ncbi:MAG: sensor histidine kinase [Solirubrobacterales bacterium]
MGELIASGWLFAVVPAVALVRERVRGRRRRRDLNRSLHELRRPLQALALAGNAGRAGFLDLALAALTDVDRAINGARGQAPRLELVSCRELVVAAAGRWRASDPRLELRLYWDAGGAMVLAEPERIAQALDNLIANALEHGGSPLQLTGSVVSGRVRITLSDSGAGLRALSRSPEVSGNGSRPAPDARRGHGLRVVSEVAAAHGGRFALGHSHRGAVAALELPLARAEALAA